MLLKIPWAREMLNPQLDVLGREVPNNNNFFDAFINPANYNQANPTPASEEMYDVYQATGDKAVIPAVAPYNFTVNGEKISLSIEQRNEYQKIIGDIAIKSIEDYIKTDDYNAMSDADKAEAIKDIYSYATAVAKARISDYELSDRYKNISEYVDGGYSVLDSFTLAGLSDKQQYMWDYVSSQGLKLEQYTRALDAYYEGGTPSKEIGVYRLIKAGFTPEWSTWFYNKVINNKDGTGGAETPEKKDYIIKQLAQKGYDESYYDKAYEAYKKYGTKEVRVQRIVDAGYSRAWAEWFYEQMQKKVKVDDNGNYYLY